MSSQQHSFHDENLPEVVTEDSPEVYLRQPTHAEKQTIFPYYLYKASAGSQSAPSAVTTLIPWWRHPRSLWLIILTVFLAMGTAVAVLAVLLAKQLSRADVMPIFPSSMPEPPDDSNPDPKPSTTCRHTLCTSMITIVDDTTPSSPPNSKLFFALAKDSTILTRRGDGTSWFTDWTSVPLPDTANLKFLSQPSAVSYQTNSDGPATTVLAIDSNQNLRSKTLRKGTWDTEWINLRGGHTTPVSVCSNPGSRSFDIWSTGTDRALLHMHWNDSMSQYTPWMSETGTLTSAPFASCAGGDRGSIQVALLGAYIELPYTSFIKRWDGRKFKSEQFQEPTPRVQLTGDPVAVSLGPDRTDYFGIGKDDFALYHFSWTADAGLSSIRSLGGRFESIPLALVGGKDMVDIADMLVVGKDRVDVLVVGKDDDRLKHKALIGSTWGKEWNDLGGRFNSAPSGFVKDGKAFVYGLSNNGSMFHASWTVGIGYEWSDGSPWVIDGGNLTTEGFRKGMS
ncbi:hypothetical protein QBC38DRAFT_503523 [Podospora fimiseda]|uniref:PLL-like beta propeller domain-containing protein n=1 Tax=Podospora fimiseda TaxID=252190 RepID=A0AAN7BGT7_9PEZI|nr:hypothetical protein QBC38DRAFT_503523 [Podospora fimiseda]